MAVNRQVAESSKKVGTAVSQSSKKSAQNIDRLSGSTNKAKSSFGNFASKIKSWATGLVGVTAIIAGITKAIRSQIQAMEEHARIAAEQQRSLLSLQYLGDFFKERPQLRKEVAGLAEYGARPFGEVAEAWYNLRSKAARLTQGQRDSILKESLELGRTQPMAPLGTMVDMMSLYTKLTKETDINKVQNIIQQTITEAGGGAADVASFMPTFLPVGMAGGLTGPQAAGLWSHVTTTLKDPSKATTGLIATFMALQGRGTPESQLMLQQLDIAPGMNFLQKIGALSGQQRAGKFNLGQAELLAGREGSPVLLLMLGDILGMMETISNVTGAARGDIDLTRTKIEGLMATDEYARLEETYRRLKIAIENLKGGDIESLKQDVYLKTIEKEMRVQGAPEWLIKTVRLVEKTKGGLGFESPYLGEGIPPPEWVTSLSQPPPPVIMAPPPLDNITNQSPEIHYHNDMIFFPVVDPNDLEKGPHAGGELRL